MFFGWYVVAGTFVVQMFVIGFFTYAVSLVVPHIQQEFDVSLAEVMYSLTAGTFGGMVLMPLAGVMLDRYPVRWIMAAGTALFAAGLWVLANTTSILQFIVIFGLTMSVANCFAGSAASQTTIARWFTASRGKAMGISAIGTSVGGIAIPALIGWWLTAYGWRSTLEYLALLVLFLVLPFVVASVRGKPSDIGALPEGGETEAAAQSDAPELGLADIARYPGYWFIGIPLGLLFSVYSAILANIAPYATGVGASAAQASSLIMALALSGLLGKIVFGMAADKINLKVGLWIAMAFVLAAFLIMASEPAFALVMLASCFLGLASGGMLPVWGAMMAKVFGLASYGRAMGLMGPLITLMVMPGFVVTGKLFDATGSYQLCLLVYAAVVVVAMAVLLPLRLDAESQ